MASPTHPSFALWRGLGRALTAAEISSAQNGRAATDDELDALHTEAEYALVGQRWCTAHCGQLYLLTLETAKAEYLSRNQLSFGLDHIRRKARQILEPLKDTPGGKYLLDYVAENGEGNREQFMHLLVSLRTLISG